MKFDVTETEIPIANINVPNANERRMPDAEIEPELIQSIKENGLFYPIIVVPSETDRGYYRLIAGMNRINAFFRLERTHIPARIYPAGLDETTLELIEIEENLCRSELTTSQRFKALAKQKKLYEMKNPETRKGFINRLPEAERGKSFVKVQAEKLGRSKRYVFDAIAVGDKLDDEAVAILNSSKNKRFAKSRIDLEQLSKSEPSEQIEIAEIAKEKGLGSFGEAVRVYRHPENYEENSMTKEEKKESKKIAREYADEMRPDTARGKFNKFVFKLQEESKQCFEEILPTALEDGVWKKKTLESYIEAINVVSGNLDKIKRKLEEMCAEQEK
jgi:hypothetical protein